MALKSAGFLRFLLALAFLQVASACGGDDTPPPVPPPEDTTAPTTRADPAGGTFTAATSVTLTCEDRGGSGCAATHYTTDGSTPTTGSPQYSAPLAIAATTTLKFFSVDAKGNAEAVKTETYTFPGPADTTAPTVSASPAGGTYTEAQTVTLTCNDGTGSGCASIRYTTDGSTPTASSAAYTAPITISANTTLKFFATDVAGNASAVVTETYVINLTPADTTAPTVAASPAGGTYNTAQTVTLTCDDGTGSGCASIRFTLDGTTPTAASAQYTAPLSLTANTTLKFLGIDNAGNTSAVVTQTYVIDTTGPTVVASPIGGTYNSARSVTLTCNDGTGTGCASIRYTTNGSTPTATSAQYTAPISISATTTLKFIGIDNAGNTSAVGTEDYIIDTVAPTAAASPIGGSYTTAQSVTLSCSDGANGTGCASIRYTLDGSTPTAASTQYTAPLNISATTTLKFIGIDNAGNTSAVGTESYVIDITAPTVTASPIGGTYNSARSVTLSCNDGANGSGCASIRYTTDGSPPTAASTQYTAPISIATTTTLKFIGIDNTGNTSAVFTEDYIIDTVAPTVAANPTGGTFNTFPTVTVTCNDAGGSGCASIRYTLDGSNPTPTSGEFPGPLTITSSVTVKFIGVDNAGNVSAVGSETYVIDNVAPTVAINPTGGTFNTFPTVTVTCNDGTGTGCASIRYTADGSIPDANSAEYPGPLTITATVTLTFIAFDNAGNASAVSSETYVIDIEDPTVAANPTGGTFGNNVSVILSCDDGTGTGCASIRYTTDGSNPTPTSAEYSAALLLTANTTLKFIGIDNAGNLSAVQTETYVIDTTDPTVAANPTGGSFANTVSVILSCDDGAGTGCSAIHYTTDGSNPTTASPQYSAALLLSANTTLKFIGVDNAGNISDAVTEVYVIDTTAPTTSAAPPGGAYGSAVLVNLTCDDGTGVGCGATYYTMDGSTPTTNSPQYSVPLNIAANTTLKFFSVDTVGNSEAVKTAQYFIGTAPADTSAQIALVRAEPDGPISLPIDLALVTYIKPAVGTDPAGFFLQAEQQGPAIFIRVDPATMNPVPGVGDRVSLVAQEKLTVAGLVQVTVISNAYTVLNSDESVEPLRANVSSINLPAVLADYESELISVSGTLLSNFVNSGTGHVSSNLSTIGVPTGTNLQLRLPAALPDQLDLVTSCNVTVDGPIWRFNAAAQPSAYSSDDLTLLSCPQPKLLSAAALSPTSVSLRFDRRIDPASVQANGSQFTFNNGLSATNATSQPATRQVVLTTVAQTGGQSYTVTVAPSVRDFLGASVSPTANTATFTGYQAPATLRITEVAPNIANARDLVELHVVQGGSVANFTLVQDSTTVLATLPAVQVATGDIIVVHLVPAAANNDAPGSETTSKNQYAAGTYIANYDTAWDFHGGTTGITYSSRILRIRDAAGTTQDGGSFVNTSLTAPGTFPAELKALQDEGLWLPANCGGVPCTATSTPTAAQVSVNWQGSTANRTPSNPVTGNTVARVSASDTNMAGDWAVGPHTLGSLNP
jgi:hypothetical protein